MRPHALAGVGASLYLETEMPKNRPCRYAGCTYPCIPQKRSCGYHWLLEQPIEVQEERAKVRLARTPADQRRARVAADQWPPGCRWCSGCQSMVPTWYCQGSRCRACSSMAGHRARVEKEYGLEKGGYDAILALQRGVCGICGCTPRTRRLALDHDHQTGEPRGLLCSRCNHDLLGAAHDSLEILRRAVAYMEDPPAQRSV